MFTIRDTVHYCMCLSILESKLYGFKQDLSISIYSTVDSERTDRNLFWICYFAC